jgi:hypothetical protein
VASSLVKGKKKMKVYAVGQNGNCIELSFASEDDADLAFNQSVKDRKGFGEVVDMTGRKKVVNVFCGYSINRSEIMYPVEKETASAKIEVPEPEYSL